MSPSALCSLSLLTCSRACRCTQVQALPLADCVLTALLILVSEHLGHLQESLQWQWLYVISSTEVLSCTSVNLKYTSRLWVSKTCMSRHCLSVYRRGATRVVSCDLPGVIPASEDQSKQQGLSEEDDKASTQFSVGSDALVKSWFQNQPSLDMKMCCNMVCMALAVLHRMKRFHTVVQVMLLAVPFSVHRP